MKKFIPGLLVLLSAVFGGCVSQAPVDRRVTIAEDIDGDVLIADVRCAMGRGEYCTFQANAVNDTSSDCAVEWKVVWLDADGLAIESAVSTWNKCVIGANEVVGLTSTAPCREAVDMRFYLRRRR